MAGKGWIAPSWPIEFGGMGLTSAKLLIFLEQQSGTTPRVGVSSTMSRGFRHS